MPELEKVEQHHTDGESQHLDNLRRLIQRIQGDSTAPLDDMTVEALAETTGSSPEFVRIAMQQSTDDNKKLRAPISEVYYSLDPTVRTPVTCAVLGGIAGFFAAVGRATDDPFSFWAMLVLIMAMIAIVPVVRARDQKAAALGGAAFGAMLFFATVLFTSIMSIFHPMHRITEPFMLLMDGGLGAFIGSFAFRISRQKFGVKDAKNERQELLAELMELQKKLTAHEENVAFLSVDIAGSTSMKLGADPLAIEFTFTEYHKYVEMIVTKNGGKVHSTAGDGVTAVFEYPGAAFQAARTMQRGLPEFNTFRNRLSRPIQLRAGLHYGSVVAPEPGATSVNFSHVIDHAAHLQKECPVGGVLVSEAAAKLISNGAFEPGSVEVDGLSARTWLPRMSAGQALQKVAPPPLPGTN